MESSLQHWALRQMLSVLSLAVTASNNVTTTTDLKSLQGTWLCVATTKDGDSVNSYVGVRAIIEGENLTWYFPQKDGSYREQQNKFRVNNSSEPKHFDWWPVDKPESVDRRIYSISGNVLRMATNLDYKTRPATFESAQWQFTVRRVDSALTIKGWGTVIDPDGDCTLREDKGEVTIKVPGTLHDLWFGQQDEKKRFNAPRILQEVEGDFAAQVKVTADWKPGAKIPIATNQPYNGAGLLVWESEKHLLRLERNLCVHSKHGTFSFITPIYDRDGKRVNATKTSTDGFFKGSSTWLRVKRDGQKISTAISHDGRAWTETGNLETEFPKKVQVGIAALNGSAREFVVEFADFQITQKGRTVPAPESDFSEEQRRKVIEDRLKKSKSKNSDPK
jgi:uncharacterized protein (TIGR03067 family)